MNALVIDQEKARSLYPTASPDLKTLLESHFDKKQLATDITDRVKTIQDAYRLTGKTRKLYSDDTDEEIAYRDLKTVIEALNEGWTPEWKDESQYKYFPWFYMDKKGSGFCLYNVDWGCSHSDVPSRLCFKSEKLARYAAAQFIDLYKAFYTL